MAEPRRDRETGERRPGSRPGPPWRHGRWEASPGRAWWDGRNYEAWKGFGKSIALKLVFLFAAVVLFFLAVGALIATGLAGVSGGGRFLIVAVTPIVVFVILGLIARTSLRTWRPVRDLIRAAGKLADGDYTARVGAAAAPSMRPVVDSFNRMADRLEHADEQRRRLLADLGHELRTPLTVVRGEIEAMIDGVHAPDRAHLEPLLEEVGVMERLLEDLRTLSMAEAGALALHPESTDVTALVEDVGDAYRRTAAEQAVVLDVDLSPALGEVTLDPVRIREVLANLVVNALRAMPDGGHLRLSARRTRDSIVLEVADTGVGIAAEDLDSVFERFRRGSTSKGSGLGLTISRDLVEAHGGTIALESAIGVGTTVTVTLPAAG